MPLTRIGQMSRLVQLVFIIIFLSITVGTTALMVYWLNEPGATAYIGREVETPFVRPGGDFILSVKVYRTKRCDSTVRRFIFDSNKRSIEYKPQWRPAEEYDQREGVYEMNPVKLTIPTDAAPGAAQFRAEIDWQCNPLQRIWPLRVQLPDVPFTILFPKP